MMGGRGGNRQMRRMMDKMGLDMEELPNVQEVIIKTDKKEIIIAKPAVTEMKAKDNSIFQVVAESYEEKELEVQSGIHSGKGILHRDWRERQRDILHRFQRSKIRISLVVS